MTSVRLLSEEESAAVAEVSVETIRKYRDCGLLDPVLKDNQTFFQEVDIQTLFFTKTRKEGLEQNGQAASLTPEPQREPVVEPQAPPSTAVDEKQTALEISASSGASENAERPVLSAEQPQESASLRNADTIPTETPVSKPVQAFISESKAPSEPIEISSKAEVAELPSSTELIELNKSLRDQIQILREERDWLRDRVEKLESRSEREQMLLLSESENVRKLIVSNQKSFWQKALPWFSSKS
jgi:DNA-binding transcriptional MerR regulator